MNRVPSKWNVGSITLLALLAIGIVYSVILNFSAYTLIPVIVLGVIFWLYKYPPAFLKDYGSTQGRTVVKQSRATAAKVAKSKTKTKGAKSKTVPFRVIEGGKDDDDLPKYH